jgi:hypothetical protein
VALAISTIARPISQESSAKATPIVPNSSE